MAQNVDLYGHFLKIIFLYGIDVKAPHPKVKSFGEKNIERSEKERKHVICKVRCQMQYNNSYFTVIVHFCVWPLVRLFPEMMTFLSVFP